MYIMVNAEKCPDFKKKISDMIDKGEISNWEFVSEEGKRRLIYKSCEKEYEDVVLRFLYSSDEGGLYVKIRPAVKAGVIDEETAISHFGIVLGRFAEIINCYCSEIGTYVTTLD